MKSSNKTSDIALRRLVAQRIAAPKESSVKDLVGWMGALQAQDYEMAKWAVGLRLPDMTDCGVEAAIDNGEILRIHVLRPTWHFVAAVDARWMLELTVPRIKSSMKARNEELELSAAVLKKSRAVLEKVLGGERHLTRRDLLAEFEKAGIATNRNRGYHFLMEAELERLICSGASRNGDRTYALLDERVPETKRLTRDEALAALAKRYFTGHGPAALEDFIWWSGLSVGDAKKALEYIKTDLLSETFDSRTYWFAGASFESGEKENIIHALPAFDEFLIGYKDRRDALPSGINGSVIHINGIFRPIIVDKGRVTGIWSRKKNGTKVIVEPVFFREPGGATIRRIGKAFQRYGRFLEKPVEIRPPSRIPADAV